MPEENHAFTPAARLMQTEEIAAIAKLFVREGVKKIRLTGGEPLVRRDISAIIRLLSELPVELVMTTNGTRVHEFIHVLNSSSIRTVNISLDTLHPEKFLLATKRNLFHQVRSNIERLLQHGFRVKVNMVVMKGFNEEEIVDFISWTKHIPIEIRFIEFMPFSGNQWAKGKVFTMEDILQKIGEKYHFLPLSGEKQDTAKPFMIPGHTGSFAIISSMSEPFCSGCNRMRLTADGKLKNCLFSNGETDLLSTYRNGGDIVRLIKQSIMSKALQLGGQFSGTFDVLNALSIQNRSMIAIGG